LLIAPALEDLMLAHALEHSGDGEVAPVVRSASHRLAESDHLRQALANSLEQAFTRTVFYGRLFRKQLRSKPITGGSVADIFFDLPFTSKEDVVRTYPYGFLAVDRKFIAAYFESSGTTGNTVHSTKSASFFTHGDISKDAQRRFSPDLGITESDVVLNALPFALTSSGLGFQQATLAAGACGVTVDSGSVLSSHLKHLDLMKELDATIFVTSLPLLYSALLMMEGRDPRTEFPSLRAIQLCGLATLRRGQAKIAKSFGVPVFNTYGLSEFGATTFGCRDGHMHIHDDAFFMEIVDPRTGEANDDGKGGEIVVTTLTREASPKIRYRTGDFGYIENGSCSCGRSSPRLVVKGRLRDVALFAEGFRLPIDFEECIYDFPETTGLYRLRYEALEDSASKEQHTKAAVTVDVADPNATGLHQRIEQRLKAEVTSDVTAHLVRTGAAQANILDQQRFASVRTVKSAILDDGRPQEWLVTY
jgi:phenylacetate-CoA ligase